MTEENRKDTRPHSRACGINCRGHGAACSPDCPTCGGRPERLEPPAKTSVSTVQVVAAPAGWPATVVLDGVDVSRQVEALHLTGRASQIPRVVLEVLADFSYEGPAEVTVVNPAAHASPWQEQAAEWLASLDMVGVSRRAMESTTDMATSPAELVRDQLLRELKSRG